jgi:hypothetical protein
LPLMPVIITRREVQPATVQYHVRHDHSALG